MVDIESGRHQYISIAIMVDARQKECLHQITAGVCPVASLHANRSAWQCLGHHMVACKLKLNSVSHDDRAIRLHANETKATYNAKDLKDVINKQSNVAPVAG